MKRLDICLLRFVLNTALEKCTQTPLTDDFYDLSWILHWKSAPRHPWQMTSTIRLRSWEVHWDTLDDVMKANTRIVGELHIAPLNTYLDLDHETLNINSRTQKLYTVNNSNQIIWYMISSPKGKTNQLITHKLVVNFIWKP